MITTRRDATVIALVAPTILAGAVDASIARVRLRMQPGTEDEFLVSGSPTPLGNQKFSFSTTRDGMSVTWDYAADLDPNGTAVVTGSTTLQNLTSKALSVQVEFSVPLCPSVIAGAAMGGVASVKLVANGDGGTLSCPTDDKELDAALSDGAATVPLFWCPFELSITGAGTAMTSTTFGAPIPSLIGPESVTDLGHAVSISVSPGDKAVMTLIYVVKGDFEKQDGPECLGDINRDHVVDGGDLAFVLNQFETLAGCGEPADVNRDGIVDGADLAELLQFWGGCSKAKDA